MHVGTFSLAIVASLAALTCAIPSPDGQHRHHSKCHVGKPPPQSTRCYTEIAATSPKHKPLHKWNTQWTSCTVTATCTTTVTSTPTYVFSIRPPFVIQSLAEQSDRCRVSSARPRFELFANSWHQCFRSTVTTTSTVTSDTTSTVPASASFTPIQTSLPGSTYGGSGGPDPVSKRDLGISLNPRSSKNSLILGKSYQQGVQCYRWAHKKCTTTTTTVTSTVVEATSTSLTTVGSLQ
jgi:hypothetical protein